MFGLTLSTVGTTKCLPLRLPPIVRFPPVVCRSYMVASHAKFVCTVYRRHHYGPNIFIRQTIIIGDLWTKIGKYVLRQWMSELNSWLWSWHPLTQSWAYYAYSHKLNNNNNDKNNDNNTFWLCIYLIFFSLIVNFKYVRYGVSIVKLPYSFVTL